jgi:hypothetical protein
MSHDALKYLMILASQHGQPEQHGIIQPADRLMVATRLVILLGGMSRL